jgi:hypothetical protein
MRVYLRYAVKETFGNLWRNRMMTIAAVSDRGRLALPGRGGVVVEAERRPGLRQTGNRAPA